MGAPDGTSVVLHASCVAHAGRGVLILGRSGAGKSALALELLALGADLVSDDRTRIRRAPAGVGALSTDPRRGRTECEGEGHGLLADAPDAIRGLVEARGIGLLRVPAAGAAPLALAVDLGTPEIERLPEARMMSLLGCTLPLIRCPPGRHLAPAVLLWLRHGGPERGSGCA